MIHHIFPCPVYIIKRDSDLTPIEENEIEQIVKDGMRPNVGNTISINSNIFNDKLKNLKQFCEQHLNIYVKEVINPKEEQDFYITQSWLNITKSGEYHHDHSHQNSIVSGVFYVSTEEEDQIRFTDLNNKIKSLLKIKQKEWNLWNSAHWFFPSITNELLLFPSWLDHAVIERNKQATTDRISISFNTFVKGTLGSQLDLNELIV